MDLNIRAVEQEFVDRLKADAVKNGRTLRGHVLYVLGQSLDDSENLQNRPPKAVLRTSPASAPVPPVIRRQSAPAESNVGHGINCRCFECKPVKVRPIAES